MNEWLLDIIRGAGYFGLAALMVLENVVPAIPSELILPFAGFLIAQGEFTMPAVIGFASAGSTAGASVWYVLGRMWGRARVHRFIGRYGRWVLLDVSDVERAEAWFDRHQRSATFVGRLLPGVRSLISIPAGITRMPVWLFLAFTAAGTVLWTTALTLTGYLLADAYRRTENIVGPIGTVLLITVVGILVFRYVRRQRAA